MRTLHWAMLAGLTLVLSTSLTAPLHAATWQPDLWIRVAGSPYLGDNIYNLDGTDQTAAQSITPGGSVTYYLRLQNDGDTPDSFVVTGSVATPVWPITYFDDWAQGNDITASVTGAGWTSPTLKPGAIMNLRLVIGTTVYTPGGGVKQFQIRAVSTSAAAAKDVVRQISTLIPRTRADAEIRPDGDFGWTGDGIYNITGLGQTAAVAVLPGETVIYFVRVGNDGNIPDALNIQADAAPDGWTVTYFDSFVGGNDITAAVTSEAGWDSPVVSALLCQGLRVEVTPGITAIPGSTLNTRISGRSVAEPAAPPDVAVASTGLVI